MSYWNNNGPTSNREAMGEINYESWLEYQNELERNRREAAAKRKSLARNALAAQMITTGRGPKPPGPPPTPERTEENIIGDIAMLAFENNNESRAAAMAALKSELAALYIKKSAPAAPQAVGGAGAGAPAAVPNISSHLAILPNVARNKIASYLSGVERNHLRPIKAKIARETAKIASPRKRKNKTRRRI